MAAHGRLGPESLPAVLEEKRLLVNRTGSSSSFRTHRHFGYRGLDGLKKWLLERRKLFDMRDKVSAEIVPKGCS